MSKIIFKPEGDFLVPLPEYLSQYKDLLNRCEFIAGDLKKFFPQRTTKQNSSFYGPMTNHVMEWCKELGDLICFDDANDLLRQRYFPRREYTVNGKTRYRIPSSADLDTKEMADVLKKLNHDCIHYGFRELILRSPEDYK